MPLTSAKRVLVQRRKQACSAAKKISAVLDNETYTAAGAQIHHYWCTQPGVAQISSYDAKQQVLQQTELPNPKSCSSKKVVKGWLYFLRVPHY